VASVGRRTGSRRLERLRGACLLAVVTVAVAGCVGMPQSGQAGTFTNKQADAEQNPESEIGLFPSGPQPNSSPEAIVNEFLLASASYPTDAPIVQEYLADPAKRWNPGWSVTVLKKYVVTSRGTVRTTGPHAGERAVVGVSGPVLATLSGTGQYVLASAQGGNSTQTYQFDLVKVSGQWRISNPPSTYRLVTESEFPQAYQSQDLYFFASTSTQNFFASTGAKSSMLVPDPVFVPTGTSPAPLVSQLVTALARGPSTTWLQGAANTAFPPGTKILGTPQLSGATVTVDLGGTAASADTPTLERISAELLWTLAGPTASVPTIQSVELELDGKAWPPPSAPCGTGQAPTAFQKLASYECYDPYPSVPASFSYVGAGQPWSRCGSESEAQDGSIGAVVSVFGRKGSASSTQCGGYIDPQPVTPLPHAPQTPALSMAAVSPDGHFVAGVSPPPNQNTLYVGPAAYGTAGAFATSERLKNAPGITAISWDRDDDLWVAQNDNIWVVPGNGTTHYPAVNPFGGAEVTGLAVAPDGVRIAAIVQTDSGAELELAAVERTGGGQVGVRGSPAPQFTIEPAVQLGPNLSDPLSLTWYNADTLIVVDAESAGNTLTEVPVDGEQATPLPVTPSGVTSIAADNTANVLVVGLSNDHLEFSASIAGPWEGLGDGGWSPVYP
jgi:lipoprotein LpqB-like beta-propeller protein/sporulation and spore germination protein